MDSFYSEAELVEIGLKCYGCNVKISRFARFYSPEKISIGNNVRIDDFCIISGHVQIGSYVHISAYVAIYGSKGVILEDYTGISPKSIIFSAMDDFNGDYLIGPIHPLQMTCVTGGVVVLKKYSQIGTNCIIFPNLTIEEGVVVGACSLVKKSLDSWGVYFGVPTKRIKERRKGLLNYVNVSFEESEL